MDNEEDVVELWLCEAHQVFLKPDTLYRFEVKSDCEACLKLATASLYKPEEDNDDDKDE